MSEDGTEDGTNIIGIAGKFYKAVDLSEEANVFVLDIKKVEEELTRIKNDKNRLDLQDSIMKLSIGVLVEKLSAATSELTEVPAPKQPEQTHKAD